MLAEVDHGKADAIINQSKSPGSGKIEVTFGEDTLLPLLASGGLSLENLPMGLRDNPKVVLAAVSRDPNQIAFASEKLKSSEAFFCKSCNAKQLWNLQVC